MRRFLRALLLTVPCLPLAAVESVPPGGESLLPADAVPAFRMTHTQGNADAATLATPAVAGPGFSRVLRIETKRDLSPPWAVEVRTPLTRAVERGDVVLLRFHARALSSADETGAGLFRIAVQQASPDHTKSLETNTTVGRDWQEFFFPFTISKSHAAGEAELAFGFGFKRQAIEIGGVELLHFGRKIELSALPRTRLTYAGRGADAAWRQQALARIEQIRKSTFVIEVKDAAGQPAAGAAMKVEQKRSAFHWGTALQFARLVRDTPDNLTYREKVLELFNSASNENDLKWGAWAGEWPGPYDREQSLTALRWLRERGFHTRGHVLVWPGWRNLPNYIREMNASGKKEQIPGRVLAHIADITAATRGLLDEWDVLNEPYDNHDLMALFGNQVMVDWFKAADKGAPDAVLYLNDYSNHDITVDKEHCEHFYKVAKYLLEKGAPLEGLGLQGHIAAQPNAPEAVLATLDVYATFKLPIRITEFDIDTDDEELQADYTRDFLILAFSHPSVVGVQHWGFWEGAHWRPRSAMFRRDWSEKPNVKVYRDLVLRQWRTRLQGQLGAAGKAGGRGFHGDYVVTVEKDGKRVEQAFTLKPEEARTVVQVTLR